MIDYKIVSNWGTGLNGEITVKNTSNKVIEDWRLVFESNLDIERFWTAEVDGKEGNIYFVKNLGYNANIAPGETLTLGFSAKGTEGKILMKEFTLYYMDVYTEDTTDTDGDGLYDTYEKTLGTNPEKKDSDSDGLDDYFEVYTLATDPLKADTDGNGIIDSEENLKQVAVYNDFWDDTLIKEIQISATVYGDIYDALFLDDMIDDIEDVKGIVSGFYEIENEEEYKLSTKFFLDKTKDYNIHDLVVLKIGRRDREIVETIADEKNATLSVEIDDSNAIYCVVNRILIVIGNNEKKYGIN